MTKTVFPSEIAPMQLQQILQTAISPRPIALASTLDKEGNINLSPFSFFNMFSTVPPVLIFSPARRVRDNTIKHTLENVQQIPEVVIGTVNYDMVQQISLASTEYEKGINEFIKSGLTMKNADLIQPKLIVESPVNFECAVVEIKPLGNQGGAGNLIMCEVLKIHIQEKFLDENGNLVQSKLDMVARLGANWYSHNNTQNLFEVPKPLVAKGIGLDQLPKEIKFSKIFTGNNLGMLANVEVVPEGKFTTDEKLHFIAQQLLEENNLHDAWKILTL